LFLYDPSADVPVKKDELAVDGAAGGEAGGLDAAFDVGEKGGVVGDDGRGFHGQSFT
jgi:hypothetical protein